MSAIEKAGTAILLLATAACTTLQPVAKPDVFLTTHHPSFIVVTTAQHSEREDALVFKRPVLDHGTINGLVFNEAASVPVAEVRTVLAPQLNRRRTTLAVLIGGGIVGGVGYLMSHHGDGPSGGFFDPSCGHQTQCFKPMEE
jgi:hypothetical protein